MDNRHLLIASSLALAVGSSASAAVIVTTSYSLWQSRTVSLGLQTEDADIGGSDDFADGSKSFSTGGLTWTASSGGDIFWDAGRLTTQIPAPLTPSFGEGLRSVSANFMSTGDDWNYVPAILEITLDDGTSFAAVADPVSNFVGFVTTGSTVITGFSFSVEGMGLTSAPYATIENLRFGLVPAPGALALIGAAAVVGVSRRRR